MKNRKNKYYKQFQYRIEKKITVEDFFKIKDYAKFGVYIYIIHDVQDNNRFIYLSSKHYEENIKINPESFKFQKVSDFKENIYLKFKISKFGVLFFKTIQKKTNFDINFNDIVMGTSGKKIFKKYKVHNKKIALDNPDWYLEFIKDKNCTSHKKKTYQLLLYNNKYNPEIIYNTISSFFILENSDYQKFNDHAMVLDEGKTGKSSIIGYMGEKIDNISIAGLYGSSDGKAGKFKGGIITETKKSILIDEINELMKNQKGEKILSVLNSLLENGTYNYRKQHGQKIKAGNLFYFMGNISPEINFPIILTGVFGNIETIGRRIGIITYNNQLKGFEKGNIRPETPDKYLIAISIFMSNIFNHILINTKYIKKLYRHAKYLELSKKYEKEISLMSQDLECPITLSFFKSHKGAIDRVITRGLKIWIFNNLDEFINNNFEYNNHSLYEILLESEKHLTQNLINLRNIKEHIKDYNILDKTIERNKNTFNFLNKSQKKLLKFFWLNINIITKKGIPINDLNNRNEIKSVLQDFKRQGISKPIKEILLTYGLNITIQSEDIMFRIINIKAFENKIEGVFELSDDKSINLNKVAKNWNKENIDEIDLGDELY